MATYYIDFECRIKNNNGLSENEPLNDYKQLDIKAGDRILFKRGRIIRDRLWNKEGESGHPIYYGAYGEGEKPLFITSVNLSDELYWQETENKGIWKLNKEISGAACNFIFEGGKSFGALKWNLSELKEQGDFYNDSFFDEKVPQKNIIYMKSEKNPALFYEDIECATNFHRIMVECGHDMIFEDLCFMNNGIHAIAGEHGGKNMTVRNCEFKNIGGCVWDASRKIRFGNAVEFWDVCENVYVCDCVFDNIYDSAVTHQGSEKCLPAINMHFDNNTFKKCGMGAYEGRDVMPIKSSFNNNICIDAGEGFSKLGEELPRYSEIWPQPMGHHVFLWRIDNPTKGGCMEIKNNVFNNAPIGACIYSIISKEAEKQIILENNIYYTENKELLNRWNGVNYKSFDEYKDVENMSRYDKSLK